MAGFGYPPEEPKRGEPSTFALLHEQVTGLDNRVEKLTALLGPVLRPMEPQPQPPSVSAVSAVSSDLSAEIERIGRTGRKLDELLNRIDL